MCRLSTTTTTTTTTKVIWSKTMGWMDE